MKLTVIGFWGGYPNVNEASSGYLLQHEGFHLLIDCGSGVLAKLQQFIKPTDLDACIISHYHPDHTADIGVLQHAFLIHGFISGEKKHLPIYAHPHDEKGFSSLTYKDITSGKAIDLNEKLTIGPFSVTVHQTKHPVLCYAFRFEADGKTLVYTADGSFSKELIHFSKDADVLLAESNFYAGMDAKQSGHMTSEDAGRLAEQANVRRLILTHLPHFGVKEKLVEEAGLYYNGPIELAETGKQWIIS
ncbi:MBL fold metallo-hydrolase [Fervidibacillus halotolerans]|uniref:MBL fold metallo-hydrolase n=1 Tax=Fervidibacillus halotolerans TaxID=2980027 RepID=A0A9E8RZ78_9BACI|nr:MBL fold metallo-hydrolase [Fervidibacillus halotolerans]WAA13023.1 MBL fold metallo-hydrolase [Fervidibacillus halotolerans]